MSKWILIVGATSGIAKALAHQYAAHNHPLLLAARDENELRQQAHDLHLRYGVTVHTIQFDAAPQGKVNHDHDTQFWQTCTELCNNQLYGVILCHGIMPTNAELLADFGLLRQMVEVNYLSSISLAELAAAHFINTADGNKRRGFIAGVASVAGDRGRQTNYLYGSTKAGLATYLQGLRQRLFRHHITVTTIKPGPIDTAMTFGMDKLPLLAPPELAARDIYRGIRRGKDIIYTPWPWGALIPIAKLIPEILWKRMNI